MRERRVNTLETEKRDLMRQLEKARADHSAAMDAASSSALAFSGASTAPVPGSSVAGTPNSTTAVSPRITAIKQSSSPLTSPLTTSVPLSRRLSATLARSDDQPMKSPARRRQRQQPAQSPSTELPDRDSAPRRKRTRTSAATPSAAPQDLVAPSREATVRHDSDSDDGWIADMCREMSAHSRRASPDSNADPRTDDVGSSATPASVITAAPQSRLSLAVKIRSKGLWQVLALESSPVHLSEFAVALERPESPIVDSLVDSPVQADLTPESTHRREEARVDVVPAVASTVVSAEQVQQLCAWTMSALTTPGSPEHDKGLEDNAAIVAEVLQRPNERFADEWMSCVDAAVFGNTSLSSLGDDAHSIELAAAAAGKVLRLLGAEHPTHPGSMRVTTAVEVWLRRLARAVVHSAFRMYVMGLGSHQLWMGRCMAGLRVHMSACKLLKSLDWAGAIVVDLALEGHCVDPAVLSVCSRIWPEVLTWRSPSAQSEPRPGQWTFFMVERCAEAWLRCPWSGWKRASRDGWQQLASACRWQERWAAGQDVHAFWSELLTNLLAAGREMAQRPLNTEIFHDFGRACGTLAPFAPAKWLVHVALEQQVLPVYRERLEHLQRQHSARSAASRTITVHIGALAQCLGGFLRHLLRPHMAEWPALWHASAPAGMADIAADLLNGLQFLCGQTRRTNEVVMSASAHVDVLLELGLVAPWVGPELAQATARLEQSMTKCVVVYL
jgi:hypothetical protein